MSLIRISIVGLLVALSAVARVEAQDAITWETDLARAQQLAGQTNRLLLVHFWGTWCQPCVRMDREVLSKPGLGKVLAPFYVAVKVQVEQGLNEAVAKQYGIDVYPCDIVMSPQGQILHRSRGFQTAEQYVAMLQQAAQTASLAQARASAAPAQAPAAAAPSTAPLTDDRYSYYYQGRNAPPTTPAPVTAPVATPTPTITPTPTPVATPTPATTPPAVAVTPPPARPYTPPADNRYADYRAANAVPPAVTAPPAVTPPPVSAPPAVAAAPRPALPAAPPFAAAPTIAAAPPVPPKPAGTAVQLPPGCPPLALDGYCPVTVTDKMVWKKGDVRFGALHRGRTYLFASAEEQKTFLADPDRYSPVISGNDPVVALEKGETVAGKREFGLMCQNRMFLFASKESYDRFCSDSKRYSGEIFQALQADDLKRR